MLDASQNKRKYKHKQELLDILTRKAIWCGKRGLKVTREDVKDIADLLNVSRFTAAIEVNRQMREWYPDKYLKPDSMIGNED